MLVEELARRDELAASALEEVEELQAHTERIRRRAQALVAFEAALPTERARRADAVRAADDRLASATAELARAELELARAEERGREQERALAARTAAEAQEGVRVASGELERARDSVTALEAEADAAHAEAATLEHDAAETASRLAAVPRVAREATAQPAPGLADIEAWGARARAALLVVHGSLASERDAIVREANELGSALLGEPLGATSVAGIRARVARAHQAGSP
jgi:colicin import membrane protein